MQQTRKRRFLIAFCSLLFACIMGIAVAQVIPARADEKVVFEQNTATYSLSTCGNYPWKYDNATNTFSSGNSHTGDSTSYLTLTVKTDGDVAFTFYNDSEEDCDYFYIRHYAGDEMTVVAGDSLEVGVGSGHIDFAQEPTIVHVKRGDKIEFGFVKDPAADGEIDDCMKVKGLKVDVPEQVTLTAKVHGSGTIDCADQTGQTQIEKSGAPFGDSITFTAKPNAESESSILGFAWLSSANEIMSTDYELTVSPFLSDETYTAYFITEADITDYQLLNDTEHPWTYDSSEGAITSTNKGDHSYSTLTLTAMKAGFVAFECRVDGATSTSGSPESALFGEVAKIGSSEQTLWGGPWNRDEARGIETEYTKFCLWLNAGEQIRFAYDRASDYSWLPDDTPGSYIFGKDAFFLKLPKLPKDLGTGARTITVNIEGSGTILRDGTPFSEKSFQLTPKADKTVLTAVDGTDKFAYWKDTDGHVATYNKQLILTEALTDATYTAVFRPASELIALTIDYDATMGKIVYTAGARWETNSKYEFLVTPNETFYITPGVDYSFNAFPYNSLLYPELTEEAGDKEAQFLGFYRSDDGTQLRPREQSTYGMFKLGAPDDPKKAYTWYPWAFSSTFGVYEVEGQKKVRASIMYSAGGSYTAFKDVYYGDVKSDLKLTAVFAKPLSNLPELKTRKTDTSGDHDEVISYSYDKTTTTWDNGYLGSMKNPGEYRPVAGYYGTVLKGQTLRILIKANPEMKEEVYLMTKDGVTTKAEYDTVSEGGQAVGYYYFDVGAIDATTDIHIDYLRKRPRGSLPLLQSQVV